MKISENEIEKILSCGSFLIKAGYKEIHDNCSIAYSNNMLNFKIAFEPYDDIINVNIIFRENNEVFDVGWIAFVRENIQANSNDKLNDAIILLQYIDEHYSDITNYEFCKDSEKLIDDFIEKQKSKLVK